MVAKERVAGGTGQHDGVLPLYAEHVVYEAEKADYGTADIIHFMVDDTLIKEH